jgi:hypothetical protein
MQRTVRRYTSWQDCSFESKDVKQQALKLKEKRKSYNCYNRNADTLKGLRHQRKRMI